MLVLSRKKNESIIINDDITIVVVEIRGDKVRLGVEAPSNTTPGRDFEVVATVKRPNLTVRTNQIAVAAQPLAQTYTSVGLSVPFARTFFTSSTVAVVSVTGVALGTVRSVGNAASSVPEPVVPTPSRPALMGARLGSTIQS